MTVVRMSDVDAQMGRSIDPNSVPKHIGGSQGAMEANFVAQSETQLREQGAGRYGAEVYDSREVAPNNHFGSQKIISLNEAPPLEAKMEPKDDPSARAMAKAAEVAGAPPAPMAVPAVKAPGRSINELMAALQRRV